MPRRSKRLTEALKMCLRTIELEKSRIRALHFAVDGLRDSYKETQEDFSRLHSALYRKLNEAYERLFMIGLFDKTAAQAARREAWEHFLKKDYEIMHILNLGGRRSGVYSLEEEKEFRDELNEARLREIQADKLRVLLKKRQERDDRR